MHFAASGNEISEKKDSKLHLSNFLQLKSSDLLCTIMWS